MSKPLESSDFLKPDVVNKLKQEWQEIDKAATKSLESIQQEVKETIKAQNKLVDETVKLKKAIQKSDPSTEKGRSELISLGKELDKLKGKTQEYQKTLGGQKKAQDLISESAKDFKGRLGELIKEYKQLNPAIKGNQEKLRALSAEIKRTSSLTNTFTKAASAQKKALDTNRNSYDAINKRLNAIRKELKSTENAIDQSTGEWNQNNKAVKRLLPEYRKLDAQLKNLDKGIGQNFRNVGNYTSAFDELKSTLGGTFASGGVVGLAVGALAALGAGFVSLTKDTLRFNKAAQQTNAITGLTDGNLTRVTASIQATADTFDQEFNEVLRSANAVSREFGEDLDTVIDKINVAFVSGADLSGDLLDNLREYATQAKSANLTLEEFINLNIESARKGFFNDKLIDAIKEVNLRLGDLTKGQREVLGTLGDVGREVERLFLSGRQSEAIRLLSGEIVRLEKAGKNAQPIIANLFGAPGEDLGIKGIEVLATFDQLNTELSDYQKAVLEGVKASEKYNEALGTLGEGFETVKLEVQTLIKNIKTELVNAFLDLFGKSSPAIRRATEDARRWADTIKDEEIPQNLETVTKKIDEVTKKLEEARKKADLEGDTTLVQGERALQEIERLEPELLKLTTLVEILEQRKVDIVKKSEEEKRKERDKTTEEAKKNLKEETDALKAAIKERKKAEKESEEARRNAVDFFKKQADREKREESEKIKELNKQRDERIRQDEENERKLEAFKQEQLDKALEIAEVTQAGLDAIADNAFQTQQNRFDRENELLAFQREEQLRQAGDNAARKDEINREFDQKQADLIKKQAEREKKLAVNVAIGQSVIAIAKAIASQPFPFNLPAILQATIASGAQINAARNIRIPAFEEGTKGKEYKGLALVNERFKSKGSEVFRQGNDFFKMDTGGPAYVNFDKPTEVFGYNDLDKLANEPYKLSPMPGNIFTYTPQSFNDSRMVGKMDDLQSTMKNLSFGIKINQQKTNKYRMEKLKRLNLRYG